MKKKIENHLLSIFQLVSDHNNDSNTRHKEISMRLEHIWDQLCKIKAVIEPQPEEEKLKSTFEDRHKQMMESNSKQIDRIKSVPYSYPTWYKDSWGQQEHVSSNKEKWPPDWQKAFWGSSKAPSPDIKLDLCIKDEYVGSKEWKEYTLRFLNGKERVNVKNITIYYDSFEEVINSFNFEEIESFTISKI